MCARRRNYGSENSYTGKVICDETPFAVTEAFKTLRANLMFSSAGEDCPVFGTTSAYSDTGKSVITANAAVSFAYLDKKVLLIDGDMRKPVQHRIFGRENRHGLSELLSCGKSQDMAEVFEKSVIHGVVPGLDLIPCGKIPPNPSELMSSDNMRRLIEYARENYDVVFIDFPPICNVSDAGVVAELITGYMIVVRSGDTDKRAVTSAVEQMNQMKAKIIGFVLNDVNLKTDGTYAGRYSRYYRSYGSKK